MEIGNCIVWKNDNNVTEFRNQFVDFMTGTNSGKIQTKVLM